MTGLSIGFATANPHKLRETEQCLQAINPSIQLISLMPDNPVEETGTTFAENAEIKLCACLANETTASVDVVIAEDAGLVIDVLGGRYGLSPFPGIYSHRWFDAAAQMDLLGHTVPDADYNLINQAILKLMTGETNRKAHYIACIALWSRATNEIVVKTGILPLWVAESSRGQNGFGYDPIMIPALRAEAGKTMAELTGDEKNAISHRRRALDQIAVYLNPAAREASSGYREQYAPFQHESV